MQFGLMPFLKGDFKKINLKVDISEVNKNDNEKKMFQEKFF